jgi:CRISPR-associated endonuclease Cas2
LDRIQYSAFSGDISRNLQEELFQKVVKMLGKKAGNIQLIPVCGKDLGERLVHSVMAENDKEKKEKGADGTRVIYIAGH